MKNSSGCITMLNDWRRKARQMILRGFGLCALLALCGGLGFAQAAPVRTQTAGGGKPAGKSAKPAVKKPAHRAPAKKSTPGPPVPKPAEAMAGAPGRRDPFKLPPPPGPGGEAGSEITGPLPAGERGLVIGQLRLEGIVRMDTTNTMIAVVTNFTNRAYFLHVNDQVYNGVVSKITPDSVYFKENFLDPFGRISSREVVKRMGPAPGEGR